MSDAKKTRDALYDVASEEAFISHCIASPSFLTEFSDVPEMLTADRLNLIVAIHDLASQGANICNEGLRVAGYGEELRLLFDKLAPITPAVGARTLAERLRGITARRTLAAAASTAFSESVEGKEKPETVVANLEVATSSAHRLLSGYETSGGMEHVGKIDDVIDDLAWRVKNPGQVRGLHFGFPRMETLLDGLQPARLYLIGARPSVGKTAMAGDIVVNLARQGTGSLFFSCEMSALQVRQRFLATYCGVNPTKSLYTALTKHDLQELQKAIAAMRKWPVWIDDTDRISITQIESRARQAVRKHNVEVIVVDYIQLVRGVEPKSRNSKQEEVSEVSGKLKALSKELGVPIIALAQLKRTGNAYNSTKGATEAAKPTLESLKESGALEQDADCVILLHRDVQGNATEAEAIIAKNRSGSCGNADLEFANDTTSFSEKAHP